MRWNISLKFATFVTILLSGIVAILFFYSSMRIKQTTLRRHELRNAARVRALSVACREFFEKTTSKAQTAGAIIIDETRGRDSKDAAIRRFFQTNPEFVSFHLYDVSAAGPWRLRYQTFSSDSLNLRDKEVEHALAGVRPSDLSVAALTLADEQLAFTMALPIGTRKKNPAEGTVLAATFRQNALYDLVDVKSIEQNFLVNQFGSLLSTFHLTSLREENLTTTPPGHELLESGFGEGSIGYALPNTGERRLASYRGVGIANLGVITEVSEENALSAVNMLEYEFILVGLGCVLLAGLISYWFGGRFALHFLSFMSSIREIAKGDFKMEIKAESQDELGQLALSLNGMVRSLELRERSREISRKYYRQEIVEQIISGQVSLDSERYEAVILSIGLHSPEHLVDSHTSQKITERINLTWAIVAQMIYERGGVIDRFDGDRLVVLWGVPLVYGQEVKHAVECALAIRSELAEKKPGGSNENPLNVTMAIHRGTVLAAHIGPPSRREYIAVGEAVNFAMRVQSSAKDSNSDILVTRPIFSASHNDFVFVKAPVVKGSGRKDAVKIFKLVKSQEPKKVHSISKKRPAKEGRSRDKKAA